MFTCTAADPDAQQQKGFATRTGLGIRADTPAGVVVSGFRGGGEIVHRAELERTHFHQKETPGERLGSNVDKSMAVENALTKQWTLITEVCNKADGGKDPNNCRTHTVKLPEKCERDFRDPLNKWELCHSGEGGSITSNSHKRSLFCCLFLFTVKSKNVTPAQVAANDLLCIDHSHSCGNPMSDRNMMCQHLQNSQHICDALHCNQKSSSGRKSASRQAERTIEDTVEAVSISVHNEGLTDEECATLRSTKSAKRRTRATGMIKTESNDWQPTLVVEATAWSSR